MPLSLSLVSVSTVNGNISTWLNTTNAICYSSSNYCGKKIDASQYFEQILTAGVPLVPYGGLLKNCLGSHYAISPHQ